MNARTLALVLVLTFLAGFALMMFLQPPPASDAVSKADMQSREEMPRVPRARRSAELPAPTPAPTDMIAQSVPAAGPRRENNPDRRAVQAGGPSGSNAISPRKAAAQANPSGRPGKEPWRDPAARVALAWVGADAWAEAYWYEAINDPSLPASERQDLIEDLNEDGLSDPKHPTLEDLPLIVHRLWLIEAVGPDAMDQVDAAAFAEAYKDLLNLADLVQGNGQPAR